MSDRSDTVSSPGILGSMSNEISREASWVFAQDKLGRWLLHLPSGVVGKVGKVYAPGEYKIPSSSDDVQVPSPVTVAVLGFEDGNAFLADPKNFQVLTEGDVQVFIAMTQGLREIIIGVGSIAAQAGQHSGSTIAVIRAALQAQVRALDPR